MCSNPRSLLVLSCSQRKRPDSSLLPAIERYDGGNHRLLRKAKREGHWPESLDVLILSAVQVYTQEYALYVANLIHQDSRSVIKVVRYGLNIACFPNAKTVECIEKYIAKHQEKPL